MKCCICREDEISSVQVVTMEYVLLRLIEQEIIDNTTTVDELMMYCAEMLGKVKQDYLDNKMRENYGKNYLEEELHKDFN